jgi:hypothetical protein
MLVILTEEPSMKVFLDTLIRRVYPDLPLTIKAYLGKQDLEKGVARFLRAWRTPDSHFIVIHDQDSWDCVELKRRLTAICDSARAGVAVRIACRELESWYWGDIAALETAFSKQGLQQLARRRNYRFPDSIVNPKHELKRYLPQYEQQAGARAIAEYIDIYRNTSHSFRVFINKVDEFARRNREQEHSCRS